MTVKDTEQRLDDKVDQLICLSLFGKRTEEIDAGQLKRFLKYSEKLQQPILALISSEVVAALERLKKTTQVTLHAGKRGQYKPVQAIPCSAIQAQQARYTEGK